MILSDKDIKEKLENEELILNFFDPKNIGPASVDLTLNDKFLEINKKSDQPISIKEKNEDLYIKKTKDQFSIKSGRFVLASTIEHISLPDYLTAFVEGRSSIGRLGLFIQNAGWVDPGFFGSITLELYNASPRPIMLEFGMRICQLVFAETKTNAICPYQGKYQGQSEVEGSKIYLDPQN